MKVFLTGATGLLGSNIAKELLKDNYEVTALVRSKVKAASLLDQRIKLIEGNLKDTSQFQNELSGNDVLIHSAAYYREYYQSGDNNLPYLINVKATISLIKSAYKQGIKRIIYISSTGVLETSSVHPTTEESNYNESIQDAYFQSKIRAEKEIIKLQKELPELELTTIMPAAMIGPNDADPTPTNQFILNFLKGKVKFILPGSFKIVDARDVAIAVVRSIKLGKVGERYIIGGKQYPISEILEILKNITGKSEPSKSISPQKLLFVSKVMSFFSKFTGKPPAIKPTIVKRLHANFWYDSSKAQKELGINFRPIEKTLFDTTEWMKNYYGGKINQ